MEVPWMSDNDVVRFINVWKQEVYAESMDVIVIVDPGIAFINFNCFRKYKHEQQNPGSIDKESIHNMYDTLYRHIEGFKEKLCAEYTCIMDRRMRSGELKKDIESDMDAVLLIPLPFDIRDSELIRDGGGGGRRGTMKANHWCLLAINLTTNELYVMDSLANSINNALLGEFLHWFSTQYQFYDKNWSFLRNVRDDYTLTRFTVNHQRDSSSCGYFTLFYINRILYQYCSLDKVAHETDTYIKNGQMDSFIRQHIKRG